MVNTKKKGLKNENIKKKNSSSEKEVLNIKKQSTTKIDTKKEIKLIEENNSEKKDLITKKSPSKKSNYVKVQKKITDEKNKLKSKKVKKKEPKKEIIDNNKKIKINFLNILIAIKTFLLKIFTNIINGIKISSLFIFKIIKKVMISIVICIKKTFIAIWHFLKKIPFFFKYIFIKLINLFKRREKEPKAKKKKKSKRKKEEKIKKKVKDKQEDKKISLLEKLKIKRLNRKKRKEEKNILNEKKSIKERIKQIKENKNLEKSEKKSINNNLTKENIELKKSVIRSITGRIMPITSLKMDKKKRKKIYFKESLIFSIFLTMFDFISFYKLSYIDMLHIFDTSLWNIIVTVILTFLII